MKKIIVNQAQPIADKEPLDIVISITKDKRFPEDTKSLAYAEALFKFDAQNIYDCLIESLPQGTRHQLLILLLQKAKNLYIGV